MDINITGNFLSMFDPLNTYIENIIYDVAKSGKLYDYSQLFGGSQPGVTYDVVGYLNNIVAENSNINSQRVPDFFIWASDLGNVSATNIDGRKWYTSSDAYSICLFFTSGREGVPDYDYVKQVWFENVTHNVQGNNLRDRTLGTGLTFTTTTIRVNMTSKNYIFENLFGGWGSVLSEMNLINFEFLNSTSTSTLIGISGNLRINVQNITFNKILDTPGQAIAFYQTGHIYIRDLKFIDYNSTALTSPLDFHQPYATINIDGIEVSNSWIKSSPFLKLNHELAFLSFK